MATSDNYSCVGCDSLLLYRSSVRLIGGYNALLCDECRNAWHLYITNHALWIDFREAEAKVTAKAYQCMDGVDRHEELLALNLIGDEVEAEMFNESKAWIEARRKGVKE